MCGLLAAIIFSKTTMGMRMGNETKRVGIGWGWRC